jgi:hypothetical protein
MDPIKCVDGALKNNFIANKSDFCKKLQKITFLHHEFGFKVSKSDYFYLFAPWIWV